MDPKESVKIRMMLVDALRGHQAHVDFDSAVEDFPVEARGWKPAGAPHTAWELLEHMRMAQWDILEFSRNPKHKSPEWPEGYWPKSSAPANDAAWQHSVKAFQHDTEQFNKLVQDLHNKLLEEFEHGDGQTLLREALLLTCHNSYHLGQLVYLKKSY
ncbi:MAG TPA: DinB family protein [Bryobacteraceae bacterium]|jgi:hypothetical protein|nr:DinB family protein [Bryobacteraceae bacterium]